MRDLKVLTHSFDTAAANAAFSGATGSHNFLFEEWRDATWAQKADWQERAHTADVKQELVAAGRSEQQLVAHEPSRPRPSWWPCNTPVCGSDQHFLTEDEYLRQVDQERSDEMEAHWARLNTVIGLTTV